MVDPLTEIDKIGVDAFRFTLVALAAQGRDILWNDKRAEGYVKFQNKVWQAFKFIGMHLEGYDADAPKELGVYDKWILARFTKRLLVFVKRWKSIDLMMLRQNSMLLSGMSSVTGIWNFLRNVVQQYEPDCPTRCKTYITYRIQCRCENDASNHAISL